MEDASAQRTKLKRLVKQKANSLKSAISKGLSSEITKALFREVEHLFVDFLTANEDFCAFVDDSPNPEEHEVVNGMDGKCIHRGCPGHI